MSSILFVLLLPVVVECKDSLGNFKVLKEWEKVSYDTRCLKYTGDVFYRSSKNQISGIKIYRNHIYLSIPRQEGVPVTLGRVSLRAGYKNQPIQPFPSWEYQNEKNCSFLGSVRGFEIDTKGRMWVLDNGNSADCPPKLILFDLNDLDFISTGKKKKECETKVRIVRIHNFAEETISSKGGSRLEDLVIDVRGWFAYATDSGENPGIVVYDFEKDRSWKFRHDESMKSNPPEQEARGTGTGTGNVNGIALSPPSENMTLYYSNSGNPSIYSVPTSILKDEKLSKAESSDEDKYRVRVIGNKTSISDGMMMDSAGNLYYGLENEHSLAKWKVTEDGELSKNQKILANATELTWIDSFALDLTGNLYFTTNGGLEGERSASRIYRGRVGAVRSYYHKDPLPLGDDK